MNSFEQIIVGSILGGTALVPFVDFVVKDVTNDKLKYLVALVSSLFVGLFVAVVQGGNTLSADPATLLTTLATVFLTSQTIFNLYWKNSLARVKLSQKINPTVIKTEEMPVAETGTPESESQPQV